MWLLGPSSCHLSAQFPSVLTLLIDKHFPFDCKMVATSWADFLKSPTSGKKREPPFLKSLNEAFESGIDWCLISCGPHCIASPVPYPASVTWVWDALLGWACVSCSSLPGWKEEDRHSKQRTVSIGGGVGCCPQRRGDPDHKCLLCRPFWHGFGEGFGVFRCQEANLYCFLLLSPIVPHMSSENVAFWVQMVVVECLILVLVNWLAPSRRT